MKTQLFLVVTLLAANAFAATDSQKDFDVVLRSDYYNLRLQAAQAYEAKRYDEALQKFQRLACAGDKPSQATLGEMYLTGKGVDRNDLTGYEWVKVASEYNFAQYRQVSKLIEDNLTPEQAKVTGPRVADLLSMYGMRATNMSCELRASTASTASNIKDAVQCTPDRINNSHQVLLHRCTDEKEVAH
jgi:TPR repeat protein